MAYQESNSSSKGSCTWLLFRASCLSSILCSNTTNKTKWLREGLQVRENEEPAKRVKRSTKNFNIQLSEPGVFEEVKGEPTIELYGKWQLEPLKLPHAVNGIVPKIFEWSLHNQGQILWSRDCSRTGYNIIMTTSLSSDVPVGYFSWAEYDIMAPMHPKTEDALAAAFISNCGGHNFRLQTLEMLEK